MRIQEEKQSKQMMGKRIPEKRTKQKLFRFSMHEALGPGLARVLLSFKASQNENGRNTVVAVKRKKVIKFVNGKETT